MTLSKYSNASITYCDEYNIGVCFFTIVNYLF